MMVEIIVFVYSQANEETEQETARNGTPNGLRSVRFDGAGEKRAVKLEALSPEPRPVKTELASPPRRASPAKRGVAAAAAKSVPEQVFTAEMAEQLLRELLLSRGMINLDRDTRELDEEHFSGKILSDAASGRSYGPEEGDRRAFLGRAFLRAIEGPLAGLLRELAVKSSDLAPDAATKRIFTLVHVNEFGDLASTQHQVRDLLFRMLQEKGHVTANELKSQMKEQDLQLSEKHFRAVLKKFCTHKGARYFLHCLL